MWSYFLVHHILKTIIINRGRLPHPHTPATSSSTCALAATDGNHSHITCSCRSCLAGVEGLTDSWPTFRVQPRCWNKCSTFMFSHKYLDPTESDQKAAADCWNLCFHPDGNRHIKLVLLVSGTFYYSYTFLLMKTKKNKSAKYYFPPNSTKCLNFSLKT